MMLMTIFFSQGQNHCHPRSLLDAYRTQQSWYTALLLLLLVLLVLVLILAVMVLRARKTSSHLPLNLSNVPNLGTIGSKKSTANGSTAYTPVSRSDSDQLMTKVPFHDLTSDEEI